MHRKGFKRKSRKLYWFIQPGDYRSKHECSFLAPYIRGHLILQYLGCFPGGYGIQLFSTIFCRLYQIQACFSHFWSHILWRPPLSCHGFLRIQSPSTDIKIFTHVAPRNTRRFESFIQLKLQHTKSIMHLPPWCFATLQNQTVLL